MRRKQFENSPRHGAKLLIRNVFHFVVKCFDLLVVSTNYEIELQSSGVIGMLLRSLSDKKFSCEPTTDHPRHQLLHSERCYTNGINLLKCVALLKLAP